MKLILLIVLLSLAGCSFGGHMDWIEDGSSLQATYKRDRYQDVRSGMHYAAQQEEPAAPVAIEPEQERNVGWLGFK